MIRMTLITASTTRAVVIAAATLAASLAASAGSTAQVQTPGARTSDVRPDAPLPAPVGHLQPRRTHVPAAARQTEDSELSAERTFDRQLHICRSC